MAPTPLPGTGVAGSQDAVLGPLIRLYREPDLEAATAFLRANFDRWPPRAIPVNPQDHLRWKLASHARAEIGQWVAEDERRLVATHFSFVQDAWLRGRVVTTTTGVDSAVDETYRGQHLYTRLRDARFAAFREAFDLRFSRGSHAAVNAARDRSGETPFGNAIEVLEAPARAVPLASLLGRRRTAHPGVSTVSAFDERADALWVSARKGFDFAVDRGSLRLNWRYTDPRSGPAAIRVLSADAGGPLRGYAVLRTGGRRALLADLLVAPGDGAALITLASDSLRTAAASGARTVRAWLPRSHPYRDAFRAAGFLPLGQSVAMRFAAARAPWEDIAFLAEADARFHFTMGDTDAG